MSGEAKLRDWQLERSLVRVNRLKEVEEREEMSTRADERSSHLERRLQDDDPSIFLGP